MSVKRYMIEQGYNANDVEFCRVTKDEHGGYVLHSDYAALLARHNALREAAAKMLAADGKDCWDAREYLVARAEVDRLLMEEK